MLEWGLILSLIFGGCCSNAFYLEQCTLILPKSGTLLTVSQFLLTALFYLPSQLEWTSSKVPVWRFKKPAVPISRWAGQVVLFFSTNLLNNVAFAYRVPMTVHIIFRSGGLVINMILGRVVSGRRYNFLQVASVLLVSGGVILATVAASNPAASPKGIAKESAGTFDYAIGITMLSISLIVSGLMGIWQEETFKRYGTSHWQESLFYSHGLSLPLFMMRWPQLVTEIDSANMTPLVRPSSDLLSPLHTIVQRAGNSGWLKQAFLSHSNLLAIPSFYIPLVLYSITQLFCISGVNRLTTRVSSVGVTLTLAVRKAASLALSIYISNRNGKKLPQEQMLMLWIGAIAVLGGTVGYAIGSKQKKSNRREKPAEKNDEPPPPEAESRQGSSSAVAQNASTVRSRNK